MKLSIIVASCGRPSLGRTLESIHGQMVPGDELLLSVNDDAPWGHKARNRLMDQALGDFLIFIDDDDIYLPGALDAIRHRAATAEDRLHIFRMKYTSGQVIWQTPELVEGQVSTQTICAPNYDDLLGVWGDRYQGDFDFAKSTAEQAGEPIWHEDIVALYRA